MSENSQDLRSKEVNENEMCSISDNFEEETSSSSFEKKKGKNGLPNFFIDTILDQTPSTINSTSLLNSTESKDTQDCTSCNIKKMFGSTGGQLDCGCVHSYNPRFSYNYFDAGRGFKNQFSQNFSDETVNQANKPHTFPSAVESSVETFQKFVTKTTDSKSFDAQNFKQRMMWHQYFQSSVKNSNVTNMSNCHFSTYLNSGKHLQESGVGHFETFPSRDFLLSGKGFNYGGDEPVMPPRKKQVNNRQFSSYEKDTKMSATTQSDVLSELNYLLQNLDTSGHKRKGKNRKFDAQAVSDKVSLEPMQCESSQTVSSSNEQPSSSIGVPHINNAYSFILRQKRLYPWLWCTRYTDRPTAGPRVRRTEKKSKALMEEKKVDKRPRTAFSKEQLDQLHLEFEKGQYLTEERRVNLSKSLKLSVAQIKVWFQNRRAKEKKSLGIKTPLALLLEEQGLYNHRTQPITEKDC